MCVVGAQEQSPHKQQALISRHTKHPHAHKHSQKVDDAGIVGEVVWILDDLQLVLLLLLLRCCGLDGCATAAARPLLRR